LAAPVNYYSFSLSNLDSSPDLFLTFSSQAPSLHQGVNKEFLLFNSYINVAHSLATLIFSYNLAFAVANISLFIS